ncbi:cache domain-containing protein [Desulfoferula mesophila]|uniref:histidine kinase n=1 Tax=Desulfoferula mesophila TaxID=3058419 RepID=A0AAU9EGC2_9BACT|nr:hypothetical protein FAK_06750 [Desulfoferula mesophilus]
MFALDAPQPAGSVPGRWWPGALLRLVLPSVLTILLFSAALFALILPAVENAFMERKREMIRELTQSAWDVLAYYHARQEKGLLTRQQAQEQAKAQLRAMRYGSEGKDYFWVNDLEPRMVMHPYRPDLEGRNVAGFQDPHGKRLFSEVVRVVRRHGGQGYVDYMWQWKDDPAHVVPKVSFVKEFAPWGWVVGTGIYVEDVSQQMAVITGRLTWVGLGIMGIVAVIEFYILLQSLAAERRRRQAEVETERSRGMLRLVMDNIPQLIFWKDRQGGYLGCNRAFAAHVSLSEPSQIKGLRDYELPRPPAEAALLQRAEQGVMNSGRAQHHIIEPQEGPGGATLWMDANRIPLRDPQDRVVGVLCTYEDITRRREMDQALAESERRFRTLVENAQVGIAIVQSGRAVYCNPEARRILGPADTPFELASLGPASDPRLAKFLALATAPDNGGEPRAEEGQDLDLGFAAAEGQGTGARWVHCRAGGIKYQGHRARLIIMLDITKARELERLVSIQDKMASLGRVAAGIAHEIRNPLSGINLYLSALSGKTQGMAEVEDILTKMRAASERIEGVIKRVLDFSRPTAPKVSLLNLNQVVGNVMELSAVTLRKAGVTLEASLAESLPLAHADRQLLEQVLMNLITNAVQALAEAEGEKKIGLDSSLELDRIVIRVSDSGPGVPPALREKVFDPFFTGRREGSGIGLSLCHRIVSDHGGKLSVSQSRWGGAMFTMELPASAYWGYDSHG